MWQLAAYRIHAFLVAVPLRQARHLLEVSFGAGVIAMIYGLSAWDIIGVFLLAILVVALIIFGLVLLVRKAWGKRD